MIQDILPQKLYNTFVRKEPLPDSRILSFRGGQAYYRDVPDDPEGLSLTREMMITFREQKKREHSQRS